MKANMTVKICHLSIRRVETVCLERERERGAEREGEKETERGRRRKGRRDGDGGTDRERGYKER